MLRFPRVARRAFVALPFLLVVTAAPAQQGPAPTAIPAPAPATPAVQVDKSLWLYKGSDITPDPDWRFGTLPNGLRYAVRKNGVPPGQVSMRIRIDAGSLMEQDNERGYAHLIEHLAFRGSEHIPDGEAKRVWQRMGATFGADTNASTSFTQTVYKLDLPAATEAHVDESLKMLEGMMSAPGLTQQALDSERPVVLAEAREQPGPQVRWSDLSRETFFAGQPVANRSPIGTPETLTAATAASVRAFHNRWYRPERTVVVISGDFDPEVFERLVVKNFANWRGIGPATPTPDFGTPRAGDIETAAIAEAAVPPIVSLAYLRPWTVGDDTVIFNQKRMIDQVAIRIVNRRLESRARGGGSFIAASADLEDVSRSANATFVSILPIGDDWQAALKDVRTTIADAMAVPPTQAEIDREIAEIDTAMRAGVASARVEAAAKKADDLVEAVDIKETTTTAQTSLEIFRGAVDGKMFIPAAVQASAKAVFSGVAIRGVVNTRTPGDNAAAALETALKTEIKSTVAAGAAARSVSFDQLMKLSRPAKVKSRSIGLADPKIEQISFANGVNLLLFENPSEASRVYVRVRFGRGYASLPSDRPVPAYAAALALMPSGVGKYGQEELDRLIGARRMGFDFDIDNDAFIMGATTSADDLTDQLRLFAAKLTTPGWDPKPVTRAKAALLSNYAGYESSPDGVLARDLEGLLRAGDPRWRTPSRQEIEALDPASFRALWEPLLKTGPIEVQIYGDVKSDAAITAMARTFGALKARKPAPIVSPGSRFPAHVATPVTRAHTGRDTQAAAVIAWPTGGGIASIAEARKLEILAAVFRDRLLDKLRSQAGISYTPNVASTWPVGLDAGGRMMAIGMVPPDKTGFFFELARGIAADLIAKPVDVDELRRAVVPTAQLVARMSSGNMFWLEQTEGGSFDPRRMAAVDTVVSDLTSLTPPDLQLLAHKYLRPEKDWTMVVLPQATGASSAPATPVQGAVQK